MINILIPTDFTSHTLQLADQAVNSLEVKNVNIILFHAFAQPSSEFDLLNPSRKKPYSDVVSEDMRQACKQFKEKYSKEVNKICFKFMEGETLPLFRNFIDANEIDFIFCPDTYHFTAINKSSINPIPLFKKCGVKLITKINRKTKVGQEPASTLKAILSTKQSDPIVIAASDPH